LLVAVQRAPSTSSAAGFVYEFVRVNGSWVQSGRVLAPPEPDQWFGNTVALSGDTALIPSRRAVYLFARNDSGWRQQGSALFASPGSSSRDLSVAVDGQYAVVGMPGSTAGESGAAYIFSDACATDVDCGTTGYCDAGTCRAGCSHDSECPSGRYCAADGLCRIPFGTAHACGDATLGGGCKEPGCAICTTGHCVDAVCCNSACDSTCEACAASLTGGEDGSCLPIAADQDPEDECAEGPDFPASCLADGSCDGKRACRAFAKSGASCGDTVCSDGRVTGSICDGAGTCVHDSVLCADGLAGAAGSEDGGSGGLGGESGSTVGSAGEVASGGVGGQAGGANNRAGAGGYAGRVNDDDVSSKACGCRIAGSPALATDGLLPLLGLLLLGARRQRPRDRRRNVLMRPWDVR